MPGVAIHYKTGENSRRMLKFMAARAHESLTEVGAYRTVVAPQSRESGWHTLRVTFWGALAMALTAGIGAVVGTVV